MPSSKKLLIRLSSAGDIVLASPLLKLMREREPDSEIHFVVKSKYSDLVRYNPNISALHLVQEHASFHELEKLRQDLVKERFDSTLDLHNNFRSIHLRTGTSKKVSVIRKEIFKRAALVKMKLNLYPIVRSTALKYAQAYDRELRQVPRPEIFFPPSVEAKTSEIHKNLGLQKRKAVSLCPGSRHFTKRWPVDSWKELARKLSAENQLILIGGKDDIEICRAIEQIGGIVNFCGRLTLLESAAMLSLADLVITNDSFLMHAANAMGKKIVAVFGSSVKGFGFFPYDVENKVMEVKGLNCRPCSHIGRDSCPKGHFRCMLGTTPDMVYEATLELMNR